MESNVRKCTQSVESMLAVGSRWSSTFTYFRLEELGYELYSGDDPQKLFVMVNHDEMKSLEIVPNKFFGCKVSELVYQEA